MYAVSSVNDGKYRVLSKVMTNVFRNPSMNLEAAQRLAWQASEHDAFNTGPSLAPLDLRPLPALPIAQQPVSPVKSEQRLVSSETPAKHEVLPPSTVLPRAPSVPPKLVMDPELVPLSALEISAAAVEDSLENLIKDLKTAMADFIDADLIALRRGNVWVEVEIKNSVLFPSGSATLNQQAKEPLKRIATALRPIGYHIRVEGFTDNVPISTPTYPSNWELSAARAASVVHLLMKEGVSPERMAAVGYGEHRPIANNTTEAGRARNRRVVLVILSDEEVRPAVPAAEIPRPPYRAGANLISSAKPILKTWDDN